MVAAGVTYPANKNRQRIRALTRAEPFGRSSSSNKPSHDPNDRKHHREPQNEAYLRDNQHTAAF